MVIKPGSALGMAAIWLAAVAGVSATAWVAIDRAGRDISGASVSSLPPAPLVTPTLAREPGTTDVTPAPSAVATPSPTALPSPAATPSTSPTPQATATSGAPSLRRPGGQAAPTAPTPRDQTIAVKGGLVSVRCIGSTIGLRTAQPENEWRVDVDTSHAGQIFVTFTSGDEESTSRTQVAAVCTNGIPVFRVSNR